MERSPFRLAALAFLLFLSGCACNGWQPEPQGTYQGPKVDTAGAARLSARGFSVLNANSSQILQLFAPGNQLIVPVDCSVQTVSFFGIGLLKLTMADEGTLYCTAENCGQMDGVCDSRDVPHPITINISSLHLAPKAPDIIEASITATVQTGALHVSSESRNSPLCLFSSGGPVKCSVDFDTSRAPPTSTDLALNIRLAIDQRWDKLLRLEVADIGGAKACGSAGASPSPQCIDPNDITIASLNGCTACNAANFTFVKQLIVDQLTQSLAHQLDQALAGNNCATCGPSSSCPLSTTATAACALDGGTSGGGTCVDTTTGRCVPALLGAEGRLQLGLALGGLGVPRTAAIDLSIGAGGTSEVSDAGASVGLRGGLEEAHVADCVAPAMLPLPAALPLPDFDLDAHAPYDVALSVSQQLLQQALFHAQQSGALCLEVGQETVAELDSSLLATLLPSLGKLTQGEARPLRVVLRPVNPPSAVVGQGTLDANGKPLDPLVRIDWQGVEIDVYALLEDRYVRLFTLTADLALPLGISADGCNGLTPVVGDLMSAVSNVNVTNSELLAENLDTLRSLVPSLLTLVEPQLARGFQKFVFPDVQGFRVRISGAHGVGQISGTSQFNHLGVYAALQPLASACTPPAMKRAAFARVVSRQGAQAVLETPPGRRVSWRVNGGFWSMWREVGADGRLLVAHPRLLLNGEHVIELRTEDGWTTSLPL